MARILNIALCLISFAGIIASIESGPEHEAAYLAEDLRKEMSFEMAHSTKKAKIVTGTRSIIKFRNLKLEEGLAPGSATIPLY